MKPWTKINCLYQIYPRSFMDSNSDGVGDIRGIIDKLDYLSDTLGVDAVWISPMFVSPMLDCGYDVADYLDIDPVFGTLDDFKELLHEAHARNIKVMIDFVPNHTSDQHSWFRQARTSRDDPKRDYYVWRDAKPDGSRPTNWLSMSGGYAWTLDEGSSQYYLHSFMSSQPDLNWDNPQLRQEMYDVLRYWMKLGVDGFRVDAVWPLSKVYEDDPLNSDCADCPEQDYGRYLHSRCKNGPNMLKYLREMSAVIKEFEDRRLVFEYYPDDKLGDMNQQLYDIFALEPSVAGPFYFSLFQIEWHADGLGTMLSNFYKGLPKDSMPYVCLGNHDQPRIVSKHGEAKAKALAVIEFTLPGVPVVYYGEELGMKDYHMSDADKRDNFDSEFSGMGGRDPERTPMRWSSGVYAGFSHVKPWLPIGEDLERINVASQALASNSFLRLYQKLLRMRREYDFLANGLFERIDISNSYCLAYKITDGDKQLFIAVNFADQPQKISLGVTAKVILSSLGVEYYEDDNSELTLEAFEAVIAQKL